MGLAIGRRQLMTNRRVSSVRAAGRLRLRDQKGAAEDAVARYTDPTGRASLPPVWSDGVWMSRAYYETAEDALEVVEKLRERRHPSEVLLLDGRAWHEWGLKSISKFRRSYSTPLSFRFCSL